MLFILGKTLSVMEKNNNFWDLCYKRLPRGESIRYGAFIGSWAFIRSFTVFKLNKIHLHSRHYFTSSNCIFMQLQGIVFIQYNFKEMIYLLTVKEILVLSKNTYLFTKSIIIRGNYILT